MGHGTRDRKGARHSGQWARRSVSRPPARSRSDIAEVIWSLTTRAPAGASGNRSVGHQPQHAAGNRMGVSRGGCWTRSWADRSRLRGWRRPERGDRRAPPHERATQTLNGNGLPVAAPEGPIPPDDDEGLRAYVAATSFPHVRLAPS